MTRRHLADVTEAQYQAAKRRVEASKRHWEKHAEGKKGGWRKLDTARHPDPTSNEDRSAVETYEFQHRDAGAAGYFAYWSQPPGGPAKIGTFTGDKLADVTYAREYTVPAFGHRSVRVNFRARGIDGHCYSGTYFKSSGSYVRMKRAKCAR
jgi:hypothetical protein